MSRGTKAFRPGTDSLESKVLLSTTPSTPDTADVVLLSQQSASTPDTTDVVLLAQQSGMSTRQSATSTLKGRYLSGQYLRAADGPLSAHVSGTGKVRDLGRSKLSGSLDFGGFRASNQDVTGTVTLTNSKGSITLQVTGSGGYSQIPNSRFELAASVVKGTGAYVNYRKIGTLVVQFGANTAPSNTSPSPVGGSLTMKLDLKSPIR